MYLIVYQNKIVLNKSTIDQVEYFLFGKRHRTNAAEIAALCDITKGPSSVSSIDLTLYFPIMLQQPNNHRAAGCIDRTTNQLIFSQIGSNQPR